MKFKSNVLRQFYTETPTAFQFLQAVRLFSNILVGVLLVRFGMSKGQLSNFEWILFTINAFSFFWTMGLNRSALNFYPKLDVEKKATFERTLPILFITLAVLSCLALLVANLLNVVQLNLNYRILSLFMIFHLTSLCIEPLLILKNKPKQLFIYALLFYAPYPFLVLGGYLLSKLTHTEFLTNILFILFVWSVLKMIYLLWLTFSRKLSLQIDFALIKKYLFFSLPLIAYTIVGASVEYVDGFLVKHFFNDSEFAVFRYGARELPLSGILVTSFITALIPQAVTHLAKSLSTIKQRMTTVMHILFPISIVLMLTSRYLFTQVYSNDFLLSASIFNLYLLLVIPRILAPQIVLYAKHKNNVLLLVSIVETIVNIGLSILLLHQFGILGIVYATLIAYGLEKIGLIIYNATQFKISLNEYIDLKWYSIYSIALLLAFALSLVLNEQFV